MSDEYFDIMDDMGYGGLDYGYRPGQTSSSSSSGNWYDPFVDLGGQFLSGLASPEGIGALIGGGLALYGANTQDNRPTGYQGGIPIYAATRQQVPYDYTAEAAMGAGGPGSLGRKYFSDTLYSMPPGLSQEQINSVQATGLSIPSYQQARDFAGIQSQAMFNQGDRSGVGTGPYTPIPSSEGYSTLGLTSMVPSAAEMNQALYGNIYSDYGDMVGQFNDMITARNDILAYHDQIGLEATDQSIRDAMTAYINGASMDEVYAIIDGYAPVPEEVPAEEVTTSGSEPSPSYSDANQRQNDARTVDDVNTRYDDYLEATGRSTIDPVTYGPIEPDTWTGRPPEPPVFPLSNESEAQTQPDPRPVAETDPTEQNEPLPEPVTEQTTTTTQAPPPAEEVISPELQKLFKDRFLDVARVKMRYKSAFDREPTTSEIVYWLGRLAEPDFSSVSLAQTFRNATEEGIAALVNGESGFYGGGLANLKSYYLGGMTDGMADKIPASIEGRDPAKLSDGEFVVPADVVSHLGNGNSNAGAKQLYDMMDRIRKARTGNAEQGKQINPNSFLPN